MTTPSSKRSAKSRFLYYSTPLPVALATKSVDLSVRSLVTFAFRSVYRFLHPRPPQVATHHGIFVPFGQCVWIMRRDDMDDLWRKGFFGKGTLSRSEPTWMSRKIEELQRDMNGAPRSHAMSLEQITEQRRKQRRTSKKKTRPGASEASTVNTSTQPDINHTASATSPPPPDNLAQKDTPSALAQSTIHDIHTPPETVPAIADLEHVQLSLQEAFFLAYGLGCLKIYDTQEHELSLQDLWMAFVRVPGAPSSTVVTDNPFVVQYVAYHYYRSRGWVAKSGIKFGVDLGECGLTFDPVPQRPRLPSRRIRRDRHPHPPRSPSVRPSIISRHEPGLGLLLESHLSPPFVAMAFGRESRLLAGQEGGLRVPTDYSCLPYDPTLTSFRFISSSKSQTIILCYVLIPSAAELPSADSPAYLDKYVVREVVLRRWIPERNRG
ncbi:hypothetical protein BC938DRAFT_474709 [Jimgerdemannia flammicorona]|uniref:tRNA-splicing endonuclease subunit Sen2 n=1 Tax=Jimgerdemannia flammicorona TaxID=994334 RepID=A0A433Q1V4_9FUNG|nr:hypothetical protein BC938DRAFT_474709 [Jimgerdemannia flammicorona]